MEAQGNWTEVKKLHNIIETENEISVRAPETYQTNTKMISSKKLTIYEVLDTTQGLRPVRK